MNGLRPAALVAALVLGSSLVWDAGRLVWLQNTMIGMAGGPLLNWVGPGATGVGWWSWVVWPFVLGVLCVVGALVAVKTPLHRIGVLAASVMGIASAVWAVFLGALGFGLWLDGTYGGGLLFLSYPHPTTWSVWGRWIFDGFVLLTLAVLLGFGPRSPSARRAVFVGLLVLGVDQLWRIVTTILSGSVPFLWRGLGPLDSVQWLVWLLFGALGVGFVAITGNLPGADGPPRRGLLVGLALAGLIFGLQGSALYAMGLLHVLGIETRLELWMPSYDGLLALNRTGLFVAGAVAVGLGRWREPATHTAVHEP